MLLYEHTHIYTDINSLIQQWKYINYVYYYIPRIYWDAFNNTDNLVHFAYFFFLFITNKGNVYKNKTEMSVSDIICYFIVQYKTVYLKHDLGSFELVFLFNLQKLFRNLFVENLISWSLKQYQLDFFLYLARVTRVLMVF